MDSDQGKLFIGGISWDTTEEKLKEYFGNYGDVSHASVMREKNTGKPRGFGFVVFADPLILDRVLEEKHVIDGRTEERCTSTEVEPSVHPWLNTSFIMGLVRGYSASSELCSVILCFSGPMQHQIWRFLAFQVIKFPNLQSGLWWLTEIEVNGCGTLTKAVSCDSLNFNLNFRWPVD